MGRAESRNIFASAREKSTIKDGRNKQGTRRDQTRAKTGLRNIRSPGNRNASSFRRRLTSYYSSVGGGDLEHKSKADLGATLLQYDVSPLPELLAFRFPGLRMFL
ncbi:hypothetical protein V6N11_032797 [Hibiscus sabdariffa]|uniref:Uncharacterized protein n=1 Tax=Hibiscus sabdariffa TaxID=183260 RepID=A0ABR2T292_9ROSI